MEKNVTVIPATPINVRKPSSRQNLRVAAYCRVSTDHEEQSDSFQNQIQYYTELIAANQNREFAGIFSDEGISGTSVRKRAGFQSMIRACREGKVDLVITKSISRFARNTADCLRYSRELKGLGIGIRFERESIDTMTTSGEFLFTILSSLAQEESRNISENIRWGIRSRFKQGKAHLNTSRFMGYDKDESGNLIPNPEQAAVVKRIFREFLEGWSCPEIASHLIAEQIPGVTGKATWPVITIRRMLRNEKYKGDLLMQKFYTVDYLNKKFTHNHGALDRFYVRHAHEAIVSEEDWGAAQIELQRQDVFIQSHRIKGISYRNSTCFTGKVFCGICGERFLRKKLNPTEIIWKCAGSDKKAEHTCPMQPLNEQELQDCFFAAWSRIKDKREEHMKRWENMIEHGNALERLRAKQLIKLMENETSEPGNLDFSRMVLVEMIVQQGKTFSVRFSDGMDILIP